MCDESLLNFQILKWKIVNFIKHLLGLNYKFSKVINNLFVD